MEVTVCSFMEMNKEEKDMNRKTKKKVFRIIFAVGGLLGLLLSAYIISNLLWTEPPDMEPYIWNTYEYPEEGTTIKALEAVPEELVAAAHDYIVASGYNDPDITYYFINSPGRIVLFHLYDNHENVEWAYYVVECYNDALTSGGFWLNLEGKVVEDKGYVRKEEMEGVDTELVIGYDKAEELAREAAPHLGRRHYSEPCYYRDEQGEMRYCYVVVLKNYAVYVDAHSGDIIDYQPW